MAVTAVDTAVEEATEATVVDTAAEEAMEATVVDTAAEATEAVAHTALHPPGLILVAATASAKDEGQGSEAWGQYEVPK